MTTVISSDLSGSGILIESKIDDADYLIESGVSVNSSGSKAILLQGGLHDLTVEGNVQAASYGVVLGDLSFTADYDNTLVVGEGGSIAGGVLAVAAWGSSTVLNRGTLIGGDIGLRLNMSGATESAVTNHGTISGGEWGIDSSASGLGKVSIENHGTVEGSIYSFIDRGGAADHVVNRGLFDGDMNFGSGSDVLDNLGGKIQGEVLFGTGDDVVLPGGSGETFFGGDGLDTLDFRSGNGLQVSLATGTGTGRAKGDLYVGFERVLGSETGDDTLTGDTWDNVLEGLGGDDLLSGGKSEDTLLGGLGSDTLNGGTEMDVLMGGEGRDKLAGGHYKDELLGGGGNDVFLFASIKDGGDSIGDFGADIGDNDRFHIDADGFGAGLAPGVLAAGRFRARADNDAQDANDRFVFRTTDDTLWFDRDGSGSAKAVLLADLQAGAVVTSSDILLV